MTGMLYRYFFLGFFCTELLNDVLGTILYLINDYRFLFFFVLSGYCTTFVLYIGGVNILRESILCYFLLYYFYCIIFFFTNFIESYDAKIFAISSLLSSLLVYNTVQNIDQSYIDYIEYVTFFE